MSKTLPLAALILSFLLMKNAQAQLGAGYDWEVPEAHVTSVNVQEVPHRLHVSLDVTAANCSPEVFLFFDGQKGYDLLDREKNVEAMYSMLLAARLSNRPVELYGDYNGGFCKI